MLIMNGKGNMQLCTGTAFICYILMLVEWRQKLVIIHLNVCTVSYGKQWELFRVFPSGWHSRLLLWKNCMLTFFVYFTL